MEAETRTLYCWLTSDLETRRKVEMMSAEALKEFTSRPGLRVVIVGNSYPIQKSFLNKVNWETLSATLKPRQ